MSLVFVSIGSNINRKQNIKFAIAQLTSQFETITCSNIYQNPALGFVGKDFYNLVASFNYQRNVYQLIKILKNIETSAGRILQTSKFSARTLDIDVLLLGEQIFHPQLDIPRAEITKYAFVLQPLAELAPNIKHPILQTTIAELWQNFDQNYKLTTKINL